MVKDIANFELNTFRAKVFKDTKSYVVNTYDGKKMVSSESFDYLQPALQHFSKIILEEETK